MSPSVGANAAALGAQPRPEPPKEAEVTGAVPSCRRYVAGRRCKSTAKMEGKVVIITGANTGIGKETARDLARRGKSQFITRHPCAAGVAVPVCQ